MRFSDQLVRAREVAAARSTLMREPYPAVTLFFSVSDGAQRAQIVHVSADAFDKAWTQGVARLRAVMTRHKLQGRWFRVDWVSAAEALTWKTLNTRLAEVKRNYFRFGLALDAGFKSVFLEQELNANVMLYPGGDAANAALNVKNFRAYASSRYGNREKPDFADGNSVFVLSTCGVFCNSSGAIHELPGPGLECGLRQIPRLTANDVADLVDRGANYLAAQVQKTGKFIYGYFPCFDRLIDYYNALRHASSTYAMVEAWELTHSAVLKKAIDRSLDYLTQHLIKEADLPGGRRAAFLVDADREIKLGGNAVCLLALVKYSEVTETRKYDAVLEALALGIEHMQDPVSGKFVHVLSYPDLSVKEAFRIIYYDGEAAFGLMRLYGLTKDPRWLTLVEKAFNYFIQQQHWQSHDHWLSYCVNELTLYRPEERYFRFGLQNVAGHLDFVLHRDTTYPTLLELMMAAERMLRRIDDTPSVRHLLSQIDLEKFYRALHYRAHFLLNGHFWPELAMYFKNPSRIVNSFFIRHHGFRVRIDDVEHYLSGFVAYHKFLKTGGNVVSGPVSLLAAPAANSSDRGSASTLLRTSLSPLSPGTGNGPTPSRKGLMIGRLGDWTYAIEDRLGGGGYAQVYRGRCAGASSQDVAIKVFNDASYANTFEREVAALKTMAGCPGTPGLIDHGRNSAGALCIVTTLAAGQRLDKLIKRRNLLTSSQALTLVNALLSVLEFAHERGLLHKDIKASNILADDGRFSLLDWGVAEFIGDGRAESIRAKQDFVAPECYYGRHGKATDFYSLGWLVVHATTGLLPYHFANDRERDYRVAAHCLERPELPASLPTDWRPLVSNWIGKEPEHRLLGYDLDSLMTRAQQTFDLRDNGSAQDYDNLARNAGFLQQAADAGVPYAQHNLAERLMKEGRGSEARLWFEKASNAGYARSTYQLAMALREGDCAAVDFTRSRDLLLSAANANNPEACLELGQQLLKEAEVEKALIWLKRAADNGLSEAQYRYAMWLDAHQEQADVAINYYQAAAERQHVRARARLKEMAGTAGAPPANPSG